MSLLILTFLLAAPLPPQVGADSARAQIVLEREGDVVTASATFRGALSRPERLTYSMSVRRVGSSGTSTTRQSGKFDPMQTAQTLSTTRVNIDPGSRLTIHLKILHDQKVIAQDKLNKMF